MCPIFLTGLNLTEWSLMNMHVDVPNRNFESLVELLRWRALHQPDTVAYTFQMEDETEEVRVTNAELDRSARAIAARLQSLGAAGGRALLLYAPGIEYISAFFGCLYAGVAAVPVYPPRPNRPMVRFLAILEDAHARVALTTSPILSIVESLLERNERTQWVATDEIPLDLAETWGHPDARQDSVAFIQYTSGSTSTPKGVMLTHGNLLHNLSLIWQAFGHGTESRGVIWLPPYHDMGLIGGILQPLYGGFPVLLMSPITFLQNPFRWLRAISTFRATSSGGPNFAYDLCVRKITPEQRATLDLSTWQVAFNGAEPIRRETLELFARTFEPCGFKREAFYPCYGLAEGTLIVSGGVVSAAPVVKEFNAADLEQHRVIESSAPSAKSRVLLGCGQVIGEQRLAIVNPETFAAAGAGEVGEIWVAGPSIARGYWNRPEETTRTFGAHLSDSGDGPYLRTGDLGFVQDGELFITGRIKDLIIIRGRNHYPQDIELTVERSHPALRPGCGAAFSIEVDGEERLVVVQEILRESRKADRDEVMRAMRQAVAEEHEVQIHAAVLLKPGSIPKTSSGKIQRHACKNAFLEGELEATGQWTEAAAPEAEIDDATPIDSPERFEKWFSIELARRLRVPASSIDPRQPLSRYALDSLNAIELTHAIELRTGVAIALERVLEGPTIAELAQQIFSQRTASSALCVSRASSEASAGHPLSHGQRALWFLHQLEPESAAYNVPVAVRILGALDVDALRRAFQALVARHASLRTTFTTVDGEPVQQVHEKLDVSFELLEASSWDEPTLAARLAAEAHRSFDLEHGPLLRIHLLRRSAEEHVLLLSMHHIVTDFWSQTTLLKDLNALYAAERKGASASLPPLELHYADYACWQEEMLRGAEGERLRGYWQGVLGGKLPVLNLRTDRPRPPVQTYRGAAEPLTIRKDVLSRLKELSRQSDATLFMTLLSAFSVMLARISGQKDIVIGTPTMGRGRARLSDLVGYFVNPVALRADLSGDPTFADFLARTRRTVLGAFEHQDYPFATLVEHIQPDRDPSRSPVFQVMLALQQAPAFDGQSLTSFALGEPGARLAWGDLALESVLLDQRIAQFDLTLNVGEVNDELRGTLNYNTDLFDATTVSRMTRHLGTLLEVIVADPHQKISALSLMTEAEQRQMLRDWNQTTEDYPEGSTIHDLIETQARRIPDAVAVIFGDRSATYGELNERSAHLASHLRSKGVGPETLVGICLETSIEMMVAVIGVLKAGGGYVPMDPGFPKDRLAFMVGDARIQVVVTQESLKSLLPEHATALCVDDCVGALADEGTAPSIAPAGAVNVACLLYTSGSTGEPKGVLVSHRNIVNLVTSFIRSYSAGASDRILPLTSISSASFVGEIFPLLCAGGAVVLADKSSMLDFVKLVGLISQHGVSVVSTVPAMVHSLNAMKDSLPKLRLLLSGGEALAATDIDKLFDSATLVNGYGLTETTICSTYKILDRSDLHATGSVSIGKPVMNTQVYILDESLRCSPIGSTGEMYVAGDGIARGYLNNAGLTAERFLPNPFAQGARMYRTGDLAAWLPDGTIEFLGREDHQVKIRGFRIDLQEIEAVLEKLAGVRESVVTTSEDGREKQLVAYVVLDGSSKSVTAGDLLSCLREKLPDHMVPSAFVFLEDIPRLPNGKIEFTKLPAPDGLRPELKAEYVAPRSEIEETIAAVWKESLRVDKVGIHDNFFDLGGHSLLLTKVHSRLRDVLKQELSLIDLFKYPTIGSLARHLSPRQEDEPSQVQAGQQRGEMRRQARTDSQRDIAVVAMSGRFPGAWSIEALWQNLRNGVESITRFTDEELEALGVDRDLLDNPDYIRVKGIVGDIDQFDAQFFGLNPRETELMDPQHRMLLECCCEALERAGYNPDTYKGRVGVYAGESMNTYLVTNLLSHIELVASVDTLVASLGNDKDPLTSRISYKLNLKGPSITIQSASSTSLVAVHVACQSLLDRECDMALAGGVSIHLPEKSGYMFHQGGITSRQGHTMAFDSRADGFVSGNGAGVVVLKRLADAVVDGDTIYAVIKGSACNNDGSEKVSFMAPSVEGQVELYAMAHAVAGVSAESISYVECHGTGTALGDPIEAEALTQAFRASTDKKGFCALGSLKTNIGHLDTASGVCGLIKAVLALHHKAIPPSLHFEKPNPQIDFESSPFFVNTTHRKWEANGTPRRAGVTSLGMGGTNAHVILEEAPPVGESSESRPWQLLLLSAKSSSALDAQTTNLLEHLKQNPEEKMADVAFTLQNGRKRFNHRRMVLCENRNDAITALENADPSRVVSAVEEPGDRSVVFMFTGQGSQHVNMSRGLYETEPLFRADVDRCCELLEPHLGFDMRTVLFPHEPEIDAMTERLRQTAVAQPALFVVEYALATQWMRWGIRPQAMIGHSLGEFVAACLAGVLTLEDALALVAARGRLMQQASPGSMLAVPMPEAEVRPLLDSKLSLAAVNHPSLTVVSGPEEAIAEFEARLSSKGASGRRLHTSHAFHSQMMDEILPAFAGEVSRVSLKPPKLPYISNVSGTWIRAEEATDPAYWTRQLRQAVRFADGVAELLKAPRRILLEVGPGNSLASLVRQHPSRTSTHVVVSSLPHQKEQHSDASHLYSTLGRLWLAGAEIDWAGFYERERRHRVLLPTYPFERQRYWVDPVKGSKPGKKAVTGKLKMSDWFYAPLWKQSVHLNSSESKPRTEEGPTWLVFKDEIGLGTALAARLRDGGHRVITVSVGRSFREVQPDRFEIDAARAPDYDELLKAIGSDPLSVVHLWSVTDGDRRGGSAREAQHRGFHSLLNFAMAIGKRNNTAAVSLWAVADNLYDVTGQEKLSPEKATILGACRVIPREYPNIDCRTIDVLVPPSGMDELAERVFGEVTCASSAAVVALRGRSRWVQGLEPIVLDGSESRTARLRDRGAYVITGGLGGIGLEIAGYLAQHYKARLVLTGRSPFPERADWPARLADQVENDVVCQKIRRLLALEEMGAEVLAISADVADLDHVRRIRSLTMERYGAVNGIIHAAGVPGAGIIQTKTPETIETVFAPKVTGTLNLETVFENDGLDFILLCSSITALLGEVGQADYAAANAFLDAFASYRASKNHVHTVSVNWDAWQSVGMAVNTQVAEELREWREEELRKGILPAEGCDVFVRALRSGLPQVIVSTQDLPTRMEQKRTVVALQESHRDLHPRPILANPYVAPSSDCEQTIATIWQELLGIEQVGVNDNFFDLGGNSLTALRIIARMKGDLKISIADVSLFEAPTVSSLAKILSGNGDAAPAVDESRSRGERRRARAPRRRGVTRLHESEETPVNG